MKNKKGYSSRVERNSTKNRLKRRIKKNTKRLPKVIAKNLIYLIVGILYTVYLIIRAFDTLIAKLFMKLPRWSRAIIIWSMVISSIMHNNIDKKVVSITKELVTATNIPVEVAKLNDIEQKEVEEYNCTMNHEIACKIENKAVKIGMTKEQAKMSVSISAWETGRWTSSAYHNKNNVGGMMCKSGLITYNSLDEGIEAFLINLKNNYFDIGLDTFDKIQKKYCPIGAKNDPTGLNKNWLNGVNKMYEEFGG